MTPAPNTDAELIAPRAEFADLKHVLTGLPARPAGADPADLLPDR